MKITKYIFIISVAVTFNTACKQPPTSKKEMLFEYESGAIVRGDKNNKDLALVFTGDEHADGGKHILSVLKKQKIKASFFLTGNFYRNSDFMNLISSLVKAGNYLGAHSDKHLLYCDWTKRDSLLVTKEEFVKDLEDNYNEMKRFDISKEDARFFLPPFEWYNDSISNWTASMDLQLVNMTHGTFSHADYTVPSARNYKSSDLIYKSIIEYEKKDINGLNGFLLLIHIGTHSDRKDKFYYKLEELVIELKNKGYTFKRVDELLAPSNNNKNQ